MNKVLKMLSLSLTLSLLGCASSKPLFTTAPCQEQWHIPVEDKVDQQVPEKLKEVDRQMEILLRQLKPPPAPASELTPTGKP